MASKKDYGIEEHIYEMLLELFKLECSTVFRYPVDVEAAQCLNYYDLIKSPMDLTTLKTNYRESRYTRVEEVYDDLLLILRNCREYNGANHPIQKTADKFDQCIQTRWKNIVDFLKKKNMDPKDTPLNVNVQKLDQIDIRKQKKRDPALAQLPTEKKKQVQTIIYQPIVQEPIPVVKKIIDKTTKQEIFMDDDVNDNNIVIKKTKSFLSQEQQQKQSTLPQQQQLEQPIVQPQVQTQTQPQVQPQIKIQPQQQSQPQLQVQPQPQQQVQLQVQAQPQTQPQLQIQAQPQVLIQPQQQQQQTQPSIQVQPQEQRKSQMKMVQHQNKPVYSLSLPTSNFSIKINQDKIQCAYKENLQYKFKRNSKFIIKILSTFQQSLKEYKEKIFNLHPAIVFHSIDIFQNALKEIIEKEDHLQEDILNILEMQALWTSKNFAEVQFSLQQDIYRYIDMCIKSLKVYQKVSAKINQNQNNQPKLPEEMLNEFKKQIIIEQQQIEEKQRQLAEKNNSAMKQEQIKTDDYKAEDYYQSLNQTVNLEEKIERFNNSFNYETLIGTLNLKRLFHQREKKKESEITKVLPQEEEKKISFSIDFVPKKKVEKSKIQFDDFCYQLKPLIEKRIKTDLKVYNSLDCVPVYEQFIFNGTTEAEIKELDRQQVQFNQQDILWQIYHIDNILKVRYKLKLKAQSLEHLKLKIDLENILSWNNLKNFLNFQKSHEIFINYLDQNLDTSVIASEYLQYYDESEQFYEDLKSCQIRKF